MSCDFRLVIGVCAVLAGAAAGMTYMGPPVSDLQPGQISIGLEWSAAETDFGVSGFGLDAVMEDVQTDLMMGRFALSLGQRSELFGRIGIGEIEEMGGELAWGAGVKLASSQSGPLSAGILTQVTNLRGEQTVFLDPFLITGEMNLWQIQFAAGPNLDLGPLSVYGGPMFQFLTGDVVIEGIGLDIDQEVEFGGFGGLALQVADDCVINGEYQGTSDSWMAGVNVKLKFGGQRPAPRKQSDWSDERSPAIQQSPKERLKVDEKGKPVKDKDGYFIFEPVEKK